MSVNEIKTLESKRLALQDKLDAEKNPSERNRMGQFATPFALSIDIIRYAKAEFGDRKNIKFIDPAFGTGSFYSAMLAVFPEECIDKAVGYEIDLHYGVPATRLWFGTGLELYLEDFTQATIPSESQKFNLLICNPPYVRHHHLDHSDKRRLKARVRESCGIEIGGLAGFYCYYLALSHSWMDDGGLAGWLLPSEFMDVNYGIAIKQYLLDRVTLLHIHHFDPNDVQFSDALVSSAVVWFRKGPAPLDQRVRLTYGGTLKHPQKTRMTTVGELRHEPKWTQISVRKQRKASNVPVLSDFFNIKRGLATGNNKYFILTDEEIARRELPFEAFRPILPSPRYLTQDEVAADKNGNPVVERRLFLLDCSLHEEEITTKYPELWQYLQEGESKGVTESYICRHRKVWYAQENRPPTPYLCTYLGRQKNRNGRPFRFILNNSKATATNVYLMMYPKCQLTDLVDEPEMKRQVWRILNEINPDSILAEGRVYGGGLNKLEPRELGNVAAPSIAELLQVSTISSSETYQQRLI